MVHKMINRVVTLAVTGASGSPYFINLLKNLLFSNVKVNLLLSSAAKIVIKTELNIALPDNDEDLKSFFLNYFSSDLKQVDSLNSLLNVYGKEEWTAPVASGSSSAHAMVVCPCSMGTLSAIAQGASNNLIERAADVILKEQRQLILLTREMPFSAIHLENMLKLSRMGVTIMPASPGFYHQPESIDDLVSFVVARILDHLHIEHNLGMRWGIK
ncbi:MAG: UbiX family flavin prenyltransferase [gamma proteobacterium symbiont of Bathyaustriella thionipta]|nr:UbiX family flavin prenyltransferase [gamma proteobacterium symbiont of Bathyaustriella thionipta]MCU7950591.1 UbiX family flavin prenyltransferase [gamma proteobacterium symbiont of Bathyaustriella thionipta]MCU7953534.1 UbiX family flavin prenyltransferase [gamma proteobacterium symbiont of Bathyaustriella thionipta]MCU7957099.1 UbiX family flavin prenyltransferase [gamma proteobacterium symbiont of Bathyaustriella thionipta]MCU7967690.1 UbiX family flavin prenyltransferase [gamma proteoba